VPIASFFSNDYPYEDYAEGGEFIDTVPISESDRRKIAYDNAKALYLLYRGMKEMNDVRSHSAAVNSVCRDYRRR